MGNPKVNDFNAGTENDRDRISRGGERFNTDEFQADQNPQTKSDDLSTDQPMPKQTGQQGNQNVEQNQNANA
jgi:hypothetical protein